MHEPVFHKTPFASVGAGLGKSWSKYALGDEPGFRLDGIYFDPIVMLEAPVSDWASYSLLPVLWNFLLTGEQYADSTSLKVGKANVAAHAGISGFSFSSREGWRFNGLLAVNGKILVSRNVFLTGSLGMDFYDLKMPRSTVNGLGLGAGVQVTERNSIHLGYDIRHFNIPWNSESNYLGIRFREDDTRTEWTIRHAFYAGRNHVFGPELAFAYRNTDVEGNRAVKAGFRYRYAWDRF